MYLGKFKKSKKFSKTSNETSILCVYVSEGDPKCRGEHLDNIYKTNFRRY